MKDRVSLKMRDSLGKAIRHVGYSERWTCPNLTPPQSRSRDELRGVEAAVQRRLREARLLRLQRLVPSPFSIEGGKIEAKGV